MNRRGFLKSILALAAAPAIVRADSLMRIVPRDLVVEVVDGWNHVAMTRAGGVPQFFMNGVRVTKDMERYAAKYGVPMLEVVEKTPGYEQLRASDSDYTVESWVRRPTGKAPVYWGPEVDLGDLRLTNGLAREIKPLAFEDNGPIPENHYGIPERLVLVKA